MHSCVIRSGAIVRGDIAKISLGSFVFLGDDTVIRPPMVKVRKACEPLPVNIGEFVYFGAGCVVESAAVGSGVILEAAVVLGSRTRIGDCVVVRAGSVVPAGSTLAPFGVYEGQPCVRVAELHPEAALFDIRAWICRQIALTVPFVFAAN